MPNQSVVPPGGYHFVEKGDVTMRFEAESYEALAQSVLRYRLANGKPPGNPAQEIIDYVCGNWPHFCHDTESKVPKAAARRSRHLSTRVATWLPVFYSHARADRGPGQAEIQRRAEICARCPQNKEYRDGGCGSCLESISRLFFVFRRDREIPFEKQLGACNIIGQLNSAAVLASSLPAIEPEVKEQLPDSCWRK